MVGWGKMLSRCDEGWVLSGVGGGVLADEWVG